MIAEQAYSEKVGLAHRKRFAQFFTPEDVAAVMGDWLLRNQELKTVLEPAFGLGVFSRMLLNERPGLSITGLDIDEVILKEASQLFSEKHNVTLQLKDYLYTDWEGSYDGIICNPPYFKFHDYDNSKALEEVRRCLNIDLNGFTNIYSLFLLKAIHQLGQKGRAAFIIPSEFLNSDYGKQVKRHLLATGTLRHIIIFDFKETVFDRALTTSAIILLSKEGSASKVTFSTIAKRDHLSDLRSAITASDDTGSFRTFAVTELDPEIKWRSYYQPQERGKYRNLVPFSTVARVVRGIATGANDYFVFNRSKGARHRIPQEALLPCITRSKDVSSPFFTEQESTSLYKGDRNILLLNTGKNPTDEHVLNYIDLGEEQGIDRKFLCAQRRPWHIIENRPPAPIWVGVFNRDGMKFIRNEAGISNLTTFHCIYPKTDLFDSADIDLLFAYLLTGISRDLFSDNRREYGDGLKKFEPNDLNHGMMLDLSLLSDSEIRSIKKYYMLYRDSCLEGAADQTMIDRIETILSDRYGMHTEAVMEADVLAEVTY